MKGAEHQSSNDELFEVGYQKALELLEACCTEHGFLATTSDRNNYRRIWARDGCIIGLAALLTGKEDLVTGYRHTLETLAQHQGLHGEIPSNVDPLTLRVSYGGTAGRVDADLWFIIGCGQYWRITGDDDFLNYMLQPLEKVRFLLGAWEYNNRGLLYVPFTGDWADEYIQTGYVLYDQLLYFRAQKELADIHRHFHDSANHELDERLSRLRHLIRSNYWFEDGEALPGDVYHEVLYKKGRKMTHRCANRYWAPFFSPAGYGYRFDALANALVSLLGVADFKQAEKVDSYIEREIIQEKVMLLPAYHPVITPRDEDWEELQMTFTYTFKNKPYEYHNGGLWPMVTGFYVAGLAARDKKELARRYLKGIHYANASEKDNAPWSFPEFLHGKTYRAGGTREMGWNAAAAIIGHQALQGKILFSEWN